jgi:hypothetical protein
MVEETIGSASFGARGWVDAEAARRLYKDYGDHPDQYPNSFFIWQWLSLERWARMFIDRADFAKFAVAPQHRNMRRMPPASRRQETSCRTA